MPHVIVEGCDTSKNLQTLTIHAKLVYKADYFGTAKQRELQKQILAELEAVVEKYLPEFESEELTNHEWNTHTKL